MDINAEEINGEVAHVTCPYCGAGQTTEIKLGLLEKCNVCQRDFEVEVRVAITAINTKRSVKNEKSRNRKKDR